LLSKRSVLSVDRRRRELKPSVALERYRRVTGSEAVGTHLIKRYLQRLNE
jgi:hypothetical protein